MIATIGLCAVIWPPRRSQLEQQPIRDHLGTRVAIEGRERAIDGGVRAQAALRVERRRELFELRLEIRVGEHACVGPGGDDPDIAQQRSERAQADGKPVPLFGRRPFPSVNSRARLIRLDWIVVARGFLRSRCAASRASVRSADWIRARGRCCHPHQPPRRAPRFRIAVIAHQHCRRPRPA